MGIGRFEFEFLVHEHKYKPITGEVLTIGKQAISVTPDQVREMLRAHGVRQRTDEFDFDAVNQHNYSGVPLLADHSLFASFSDCKLLSADINDYEGADFVFDICADVPPELVGRFDFVTDGGSLDNVFDPFRMLENMTKMLKPDGRLFVFVWGNSFPTAYLKVSPDWLMDYCAINEFDDCKVYALEHPPLVTPVPEFRGMNSEAAHPLKHPFTMWHYDPHVVYSGEIGYECSSLTTERPILVFCLAEKGQRTTANRAAIQKHYRGGAVEPYLTSMKRFRESPRPLFSSPTSRDVSQIKSISPYPTVRAVASW